MTLTRVTLVAATALAASLLASPDADARKRGGGDHEPTAAQKEVRELRHSIAATELFYALDLAPEQKQSLAQLISDSIAEREAKRAERADDAPELADLLATYLDEIDDGGAPSAATVAALKQFHEDHRPDREARRQGRGDLREALASILTEDQQEVLKTFQPMADLRPPAEDMEGRRGERRRGHRGAKKAVHILLSPEMLELLD